MDKLILVNWKDEMIGSEEKLSAHIHKQLHRAFSLILMDCEGNMLIQKRASGKYHSGGLYANACCSHPRENETLQVAVERRSYEELGVHIKGAKEIGSFIYLAPFENELCEYEYDHVFLKKLNREETNELTLVESIPFNRDEIECLEWVTMETLKHWVTNEHEKLAYWFWLILNDEQMKKELSFFDGK